MLAGPYRAGPWPGLTPGGAAIVLGCAGLLAVGQVLIGPPKQALPDLVVLGLTALVPMAIVVRIIKAPGAATAVCGAYLLPRTLASLVFPALELPPILLLPAIAFELTLWLRVSVLTPRRATAAGMVFGLVLGLVEPPFAILLGHDPALWSGPSAWTAGVLGVVACGFVARLSVRGRAA